LTSKISTIATIFDITDHPPRSGGIFAYLDGTTARIFNLINFTELTCGATARGEGIAAVLHLVDVTSVLGHILTTELKIAAGFNLSDRSPDILTCCLGIAAIRNAGNRSGSLAVLDLAADGYLAAIFGRSNIGPVARLIIQARIDDAANSRVLAG